MSDTEHSPPLAYAAIAPSLSHAQRRRVALQSAALMLAAVFINGAICCAFLALTDRRQPFNVDAVTVAVWPAAALVGGGGRMGLSPQLLAALFIIAVQIPLYTFIVLCARLWGRRVLFWLVFAMLCAHVSLYVLCIIMNAKRIF